MGRCAELLMTKKLRKKYTIVCLRWKFLLHNVVGAKHFDFQKAEAD
jgi:hypothetical protein